MEVKHEDIIQSIEEKDIRDRKEWEHLFILKHKFKGSVRRYLLSMGDFKGEIEEFEVKYDEERAKCLVKEVEDFFHNYVEKDIEPPRCDGGRWGCDVCESKKSNDTTSKESIE